MGSLREGVQANESLSGGNVIAFVAIEPQRPAPIAVQLRQDGRFRRVVQGLVHGRSRGSASFYGQFPRQTIEFPARRRGGVLSQRPPQAPVEALQGLKVKTIAAVIVRKDADANHALTGVSYIIVIG